MVYRIELFMTQRAASRSSVVETASPARSNGPYATASNQAMLTAALEGLIELPEPARLAPG